MIKKQSAGQAGGSGWWKGKGRTRASEVKHTALLSLPKEHDELDCGLVGFFLSVCTTHKMHFLPYATLF